MKKVGRPMGHGDYFPQELRDLLKLMDDCSKRHQMCETCGVKRECERLYEIVCTDGKVSRKEQQDFEVLLRDSCIK